MSRRRGRRFQAGKGLKRPREWHHGRAQGKVNDRHLRIMEPVLAAAETELEEAARRRKRPSLRELRQERARDRAEVAELVRALDHVAPFVPAWQ